MSCPTCGHTMHAIGCRVTDQNFYWCPRCGTIKPCQEEKAAAPALIDRCRKFEETIKGECAECAEHAYQWNRLGIAEAINTPENRRKT